MFTTFFVIVCVHTPYSAPWIYPPVALYGADLLMRLIRFRIKDATLVAPDSQMTLVRRVFFNFKHSYSLLRSDPRA
jgi:ferric-chelate reductase